jgi:hypothetical protein
MIMKLIGGTEITYTDDGKKYEYLKERKRFFFRLSRRVELFVTKALERDIYEIS